MGRTSKWFRSLFLSSKKSSPDSSSAAQATGKKKGKWALSRPADIKLRNEDPLASPYVEGLDANNHAIAVAAATAAVAEAALAAARAAAEVVRLTSGGGSWRNAAAHVSGDRRPLAAAVTIQSAFRAYLARRALRALKGLVRLQALVRGHIVRKQSADMLRRMQAMARIQARASANRSHVADPLNANIKLSKSCHPGVVNLRTYDQCSNGTKHGGTVLKQYDSSSRNGNSLNKENSSQASSWLDHWMDQCPWNNGPGDDERSDKILEIDTCKPRQSTRRNNRTILKSQYFSAWNDTGQEHPKIGILSRLSAKLLKPNPSTSSEEVSSILSTKFPPERDHGAWTAENSPRVHSGLNRRTSNLKGAFTPTRSECSRSLFGDYLGHPNYMANTESSRAKVRSQSAPRQRMQPEELGMSHCLWEPDASSEKGFTLPTGHRSNAYLHSGRLRRQGTTRGADIGFGSTFGHRH